ncbi:MAG TPA: MFS transporter [Clostridia bacterium]|nr:MFS transporter [Clostridia bacterium]
MRLLKPHRNWTFAIIYFFAWAAYATFTLDFIFYSQQIGFNNIEIGILYSTLGLIGIMSQPIFGYISDYFQSTRKVLMGSLTFGIGLSMLLPFVKDKMTVRIIAMVYTVFMSSFMPLLDNWVASSCIGEQKGNYGYIRLWGSVGYAIMAFVYGKLTMSIDVSNIYFSRGALFVIVFIFIYTFRHEDMLDKNEVMSDRHEGILESERKKDRPNIKGLFSNKEYILFIIFAFVFSFPLNAASTFFPSLLLEIGGTNATIGFAGSINAIVEIPFFLYTQKLGKRMGHKGLMFVGCVFMCMRMFGFIFAKSIPGLMVAYFFMAPYTSFFAPGMIYYIHSISPPNTQVVAQTIIQAFAMGSAGMIGNYLAGYFIDSYGIRAMYKYGTVICIAAVVFFFLSGWIIGRLKGGQIGIEVQKKNMIANEHEV